jgi:hypothetical protein
MAHWGTAMLTFGNPFAWPPAPAALTDGSAAVEKAKAAQAKTQRERDYIGAVEAFYKDSDKVEHRTRALAYVKAMEQLAQRYPEDTEASVFYALALDITALPTDKTYANQLKAAAILEKIFASQPDHPGVAHYLIHSYDYPPMNGACRRHGVMPASHPRRRTPCICRGTFLPAVDCGTSRSTRICAPRRRRKATSTACTPWTIWNTRICSKPGTATRIACATRSTPSPK